MAAVATGDHAQLTEEDRLRADMYAIPDELLRASQPDELIGTVAELKGDSSEIGSASSVIDTLASKLSNDEIRDEYMRLFIGVGRGEILPFASYI